MNNSDIDIIVDWFKGSRRRLKRIEFLAALNLSAVVGYLLEPDESWKDSSIISMMLITAFFLLAKEAYVRWRNWRAFRMADKIKQMIIDDAMSNIRPVQDLENF